MLINDCSCLQDPRIEYPSRASIQRYVNLMSDYGFKQVFGQVANKEILIAFLNEIICDRKIVDIEHLRNEQQSQGTDGKKSIYDIYCQTDDGSRIIVEMQNAYQKDFVDRAIYYSMFPIQEQIERGSENYQFAPIYMVSIINFRLSELNSEPEVLSVHKLRSDSTGNILTNKYTFIFIDLLKFKKTLTEIDKDNILDRFYYCLLNIHKLYERPLVLQQEIFSKLFEAAEIAAMDTPEYQNYIDAMKTERDINSIKWSAKEEGREEGREEGKEEVARSMKHKGLNNSLIAECTGLSIEQIEKL